VIRQMGYPGLPSSYLCFMSGLEVPPQLAGFHDKRLPPGRRFGAF
jgi:hypothetical protein